MRMELKYYNILSVNPHWQCNVKNLCDWSCKCLDPAKQQAIQHDILSTFKELVPPWCVSLPKAKHSQCHCLHLYLALNGKYPAGDIYIHIFINTYTYVLFSPRYAVLFLHSPSPWWAELITQCAAAQSAASSLTHIYKACGGGGGGGIAWSRPAWWSPCGSSWEEGRRRPIMNSRLLWERGHPFYYLAGPTVS